MTVGAIGLGPLGLAVARRLLAAGHAVVGYRRSGTAELEAAGGRGAASVAAVAGATDLIVTCLPDDAALRDVVDGLLPAVDARHLLIDLTTASPDTKREAARRLAERGAAFVDAPLSGRPDDVLAGRATLFAGGSADARTRTRALLETIGRTVVVGDVGDGAAMKFVATIAHGLQMLVTAEVMEAGRAFGFAPHTVLDAIAPSAAGFPLLRPRGEAIAAGADGPRSHAAQTFALNLVAVARQLETNGATLPAFALVQRALDRGLAGPLADRDLAVVIHDGWVACRP